MKAGDKCPRATCTGTLFKSEDDNGQLKCIICHRLAGQVAPATLKTSPTEKVKRVKKESSSRFWREVDQIPKVTQTPKPKLEVAQTPKPKQRYRRSKPIEYYEEHIAEIKADYNSDIGMDTLLDKWSMSKATWTKLRPKVMATEPTPFNASLREMGSIKVSPEVKAKDAEESQPLLPVDLKQRKQYWEDHKQEIITDASEMLAPSLRTKWGMGEKAWLKLRRLWGLPISHPKHEQKAVEMFDYALQEFNSIEELRAWWKGLKFGKGWVSERAES